MYLYEIHSLKLMRFPLLFVDVFTELALQPTGENIPLIKNPVLSFQYHLRERNRLDHHPANQLGELEKGTIFIISSFQTNKSGAGALGVTKERKLPILNQSMHIHACGVYVNRV